MKKFLDDNFILENRTAEKLYHEYAANMPVIDYHCHIPPEEIAIDKNFDNMTKIWLDGDHYKWRAMRANGVDEKYCTGDAPDRDKFQKWAETVPYTMRNPLYHWTHMELKRPFGIEKLLNGTTAGDIYEETTNMLRSPEYSVRNIMRKMNVEVVCTTDDPVDTLEHHKKIREDGFEIKVVPAWRPDKAMAIDNVTSYNDYLKKLEEAADATISDFNDLLYALQKRHDFFNEQGCRLSDHGLETIYADEYTQSEVNDIFKKARNGKQPDRNEIEKFKSAMLIHFALMDHEKGWTQQFHLGALRNNNSKMFEKLGADKGFDSIGDFEIARPLSTFLDKLDKNNNLTKTILYNLNPRDNEVIATMTGNFNDGRIPGKMQYGSGWWFLDQKDGIEKQLNSLSNLGLLSRFVGMLTDSRSFLSYPRHEYFRRILCNLIGRDVEKGELPNDEEWLGKMVQNISYYNAKEYFGY
ncbi:MAG TPA: glucuronate isomerase [Bacteroidales bacterium]|nr:glucuronate isomerase [Bacteroidales bacterium]